MVFIFFISDKRKYRVFPNYSVDGKYNEFLFVF